MKKQTKLEAALAEAGILKKLEVPIIISLFDYSGKWSEPYRKAGFRVIQIEKKLGIDIFTWEYQAIRKDLVVGVLAAPPCTDFTVSGAWKWAEKDASGETAFSVSLVERTLDIIEFFDPEFWALENPVGRIAKLVPRLSDIKPYYWNPCDFGDPYTKKTGLWGKFNLPEKNPVEPIRSSGQGSWLQLLGGKSERTKELRSITPSGFAEAFYQANSLKHLLPG